MRSGNPTLNEKTFDGLSVTREGDVMTLQGTINKTAILLGLCVLAAAFTWQRFYAAGFAAAQPWMIGGALAGFIVAMITSFSMTSAPITAPIYAVLEGLALGGISAMFEARFPGIVIPAISLTFGTMGCLLVAYTSGLIRATENFKLGVFAATGAIALYYVVSIVCNLFGVTVPLIHSAGPMGIAFSLIVVGIAALNLVLDFDLIENGVRRGAPKYMEWYASFGLMVTLVWLYLEILRLLAKMSSKK
ncbi:MAG: hypothetical protein CHACPFDD_03291 [Phycisphaerae bacterium]|nr:hypothetical protein [Phycisphaerae bacterium]